MAQVVTEVPDGAVAAVAFVVWVDHTYLLEAARSRQMNWPRRRTASATSSKWDR
jgi:hypothetical protein